MYLCVCLYACLSLCISVCLLVCLSYFIYLFYFAWSGDRYLRLTWQPCFVCQFVALSCDRSVCTSARSVSFCRRNLFSASMAVVSNTSRCHSLGVLTLAPHKRIRSESAWTLHSDRASAMDFLQIVSASIAYSRINYVHLNTYIARFVSRAKAM